MYLLAFHHCVRIPLQRERAKASALRLHSHLALLFLGLWCGENILEAAGARAKLPLAAKKQREFAFMIKPLPQTH